jgi:hypothetical protein
MSNTFELRNGFLGGLTVEVEINYYNFIRDEQLQVVENEIDFTVYLKTDYGYRQALDWEMHKHYDDVIEEAIIEYMDSL